MEIQRDEKGLFKKGFSANPSGRPKGSFSLVEMIRNKLQEVPEDDQRSYAEMLINQIVESALKGNKDDKRLIMNYIEGMPQQKTDITSNGKTIYLPAELLAKNDLTPSTENDS